MITIKNLSKKFNMPDGTHLQVLKDVSCHISKGEVISIIGPSGTGKSTFLRCLNAIDPATSGEIIFNGENIMDGSTKLSNVRKKMGMVFQSFNLFEHMTVLENLTNGPVRLLGMSKEEAKEQGMELLRMVGLEDKADVMPRNLSGGQKQRVAIARCLSMKPDCILFDEPTSALDPTMVSEVLSVIRQLAKQGMTMLIVTHEMKFAMDVSTRVFFMLNKGIHTDCAPDEIFANPEYKEAQNFIGRLRIFEFTLTSKEDKNYDDNSKKMNEFCQKYAVGDKFFKLQLLMDEFNNQILPWNDKVDVTVKYSEMDYSLSLQLVVHNQHETLFKEDEKENDNMISMSIITGLCESINETITDGNDIIECKLK